MNTKVQFLRKKRTLIIVMSLAVVFIAAFSTIYILNQQKKSVNANVSNVETNQTKNEAPVAENQKAEEVKEVETTVAPAPTQAPAATQKQNVEQQISQPEQQNTTVDTEDPDAKAKRLEQCNEFKARMDHFYGSYWSTRDRNKLSPSNETTYMVVCRDFGYSQK